MRRLLVVGLSLLVLVVPARGQTPEEMGKTAALIESWQNPDGGFGGSMFGGGQASSQFNPGAGGGGTNAGGPPGGDFASGFGGTNAVSQIFKEGGFAADEKKKKMLNTNGMICITFACIGSGGVGFMRVCSTMVQVIRIGST